MKESYDRWTPRSRFEDAIRGEMPDRVPAVVWDNKLPGGSIDQEMLDAGVCVTCKSAVYREELDEIAIEIEKWTGADGFNRRRTTWKTPCGPLSKVDVVLPFTDWREKVPFEGPKSYDALIALIDSRRYIPCYEKFRAQDAHFGASGIGRPATEATPMRELIYDLLGVETFSLEWFDNRDHVIAVYDALLRARRRALPILAASPALFFIVEANVAYEIVGEPRFRRYYLPAIVEACDALHAAGKLTGAHLDANNRALAPLVAGTSLDFIESFTPPPDCDLTVKEARQVWPGKGIVCNFPSSVHHGGPETVCELARRLLMEAAPGNGFAMGVLENIPRNDSMVPLTQTIWDYGRTPIE
jgi:hypothetical protein